MTTTVYVIYHKERDGSWWADSPQIQGFTAVGETLGEVRALVFEGVPFYLDMDDVDLRESQDGGATLVDSEVSAGAWSATTWGASGGAYSGTIKVHELERV